MLFKFIAVLIVLMLMLLLIYTIEYYKINMDPMKNPVKVEEIIVETFVPDEDSNKPYADVNDTCAEYSGDNVRLNQSCKIKNFAECMDTTCCIWGGEKGLPDVRGNGNCLHGDAHGPIFGNSAFEQKEYYYQGDKYSFNIKQ